MPTYVLRAPKMLGKLVGAAIGGYLGGTIGALIGIVVGHCVRDVPVADREAGRAAYSQPTSAAGQGKYMFISNLVSLLVAMTKADGKITKEEIKVISRFFQENLGYRGQDLSYIKELIEESLQMEHDIEEICYQFRIVSSYQARVLLLELLYQVAYADNTIHPAEQAMLQRIAGLLGILSFDQQRVGALFQGQDEDRYYHILGIDKTAGVNEIKKAYRKLVLENHPDKVNYLGPEYVKVAHQQFTKINEAYNYISRQRGFN